MVYPLPAWFQQPRVAAIVRSSQPKSEKWLFGVVFEPVRVFVGCCGHSLACHVRNGRTRDGGCGGYGWQRVFGTKSLRFPKLAKVQKSWPKVGFDMKEGEASEFRGRYGPRDRPAEHRNRETRLPHPPWGSCKITSRVPISCA